MRITIKNNLNTTATLYLTEVQAKSVLSAKKPISKAMDIVRHRLGAGHGFYPVSLENVA